MYVCTVFMYVCMYVCLILSFYDSAFYRLGVCMHVCMYVCMYVCMQVETSSNPHDADAICKAITSGYFYNTAKFASNAEYKTIKNQHTVYIHPSSVLAKVTHKHLNTYIYSDTRIHTLYIHTYTRTDIHTKTNKCIHKYIHTYIQ